MRKLFKWLGILLTSVIVLIVAGIVALVWFVNPNDYKDLITTKVSQFTHRQVTIAGNLTWSFFPWIGLSVNDLQVGNLPGFVSVPFATVKHLEVKAQLVPLFSGHFEIKTIALDGLTLNLQQAVNGQNNWALTQESTQSQVTSRQEEVKTTAPQPTKPPLTQEKSTLHPSQMVFAVSNLQLSHGQINYQDDKTQQKIQLSDLNLNSKNINLKGVFFPIDFSGHAVQGNQTVEIKLQGQLQLNLDQEIYQLKSLALDVSAEQKGSAPVNLTLHSEAIFNQQRQTLVLNPLTIQLGDAQFAGNVQGQHLLTKPIFSGQIQSKPFQLQPLLHLLGASPMAWPKTVTLASDFTVTQDSANLEKLHVNLDQSDITGHVAIVNFAHPAVQFNTYINQLNTAWFAGNSTASKGKETSASPGPTASHETHATASTAASDRISLPTAALRQLDLKGDVQIDHLDLSSLTMQHVQAHVSAHNGVIAIAPVTADLYQGHFDSRVSLNVQGAEPAFQTSGQLKQLQIQPLLMALKKQPSSPISGQGDVQWSLNTSGNSQAALTHALNGDAKLAITNGTLNGVDVGYEIHRAIAFLHQQPMPQAPSTPVTHFGSLTASAVIHQGVVNNQDLRLDSSIVRVTGQGQIDLNQQTIDYQLMATALGSGLSPAINELQQLLGGGVPIQIKGKLASPSIQPNWHAITTAAANALVKKEVEKVKEKAQEKIQQGLQGLGNKLQQLKLPF